MFTFRAYLLIGVACGIVTFAIASFLGEDIAKWARDTRTEAAIEGQGGFGRFVMTPIIYVMENPSFGAGMVAVLWPMTVIYFLLTIVLLLVNATSDASEGVAMLLLLRLL